ncbi:ACP S-malonyltransferase [Alkalicella caledoniensis]|uniref:Malonyl CoA-acyl carrier protein transacylase n=1 Tax=Alkalicella caledoniensis TaxID=2731377 RepID=A0A7G9WAF1_ALKCA|nr:ACP S-malonyltransferase [Alkalicella caledoniensis]QNO15663.1 ACP S-malonyltransferase [Alkalicella caledoniensis]
MSKIAFIFPGQGAQFVGMGKDIIENNETALKIYDKANDILGYDIKNIILNGPKEQLDSTENTQPAILTMSYALLEVLRSEGITPQGVAGLSLGEYSALLSSQVMDFESALPLVRKRAKFMQSAVPVGVGGMVALVGIKKEGLTELVDSIESGYLAVANYNCPGQYVVTGEKDAIAETMEKAKEFGARRAIKLDVSGPFHSKLLTEAGENLGIELDKIQLQDPAIPIYSNVTAKTYENKLEIRELLVKQVSNSVLWQQTIENMVADGFTGFVEVGPQKTLSAMVKKISKDVWVKNIEDNESLMTFIKEFKEGVHETK